MLVEDITEKQRLPLNHGLLGNISSISNVRRIRDKLFDENRNCTILKHA
jgi:hypothetical protein